MSDDHSLSSERPAFPRLSLATAAEEIAPTALRPFATLGASERWLQEILCWAYRQPDLHAARYCYELGRRLRQGGRYRAAWPALEAALAICQRQKLPASALSNRALATLGALLDDIVERPASIAYLRRALVIWRAVRGPAHPEVGEILNNLGYWCRRNGRLKEARDCYEEALTIWREAHGPDHAHVAAVLNNLGALARAAGQPRQARQHYKQALAVSHTVHGPTHPTTGSILANLGAACCDDGDEENAARYLQQALSILETAGAGAPLELAAACNNMAHLLLGRGERGQAHRYFKRALVLYEETDGGTPLEIASVLHNLGALYCATGSFDAAVNVLGRAYELRCRRLGPQHPAVAATFRILHEALAISGRRRFPSLLDVAGAMLN